LHLIRAVEMVHELPSAVSDPPIDPSLTHAGRNPHKPVIAPRNPSATKKTAADKESIRLARGTAAEKNKQLAAAIQKVQEDLNRQIENVAEEYSRKPDAVKALIYQQTNYKHERKPTLANAIFLYKSRELNDGAC
jgi:hypothetical protein